VLNTKLDVARHEIESAGSQLELLVHPQAAVVVPAPRNHNNSERVAAGERVAHPVAAGKD
jgi:hypothetical protein